MRIILPPFRTARLVGGLAAAIPMATHAQEILPTEAPQTKMERYTAVTDRQQPGYAAPGIALGKWQLSPSIAVQAIDDDNIFAQENGRTSDAILRIKPEATLQTSWGGSSVVLHGLGTIDRYARHSSENIGDVDLGATGTFDLTSSTTLRTGLRYLDSHQQRQSQDAFAQTIHPIRYTTKAAAAAITQDLGRLRLSTDFTFAHRNYHDGILPDGSIYEQDTSDSDSYRVGVRAAYAASPSVGFFVRAVGDWRNFKLGTAQTPKRDSRGYQLLAGVEFEPAALIRGSIGVGYVSQHFLNRFYTDLSGPAINAKVEYFPTQLTTITLRADRQVLDSGIPGSGGYLSTEASLGVDHELMRSLILSASAGYQHNKFNNLDRRDDRITATARATWRLNRMMALEARYDRLDQSSHGADRYRSYVDNRLMVGITLRR
jgi:hypothetical protein